jgi:alginate O-acetyltransferase complex protein AlgI
MLFSSGEFIYLFLPVTILGYWSLTRLGRKALLSWFALISLVFYAYWNPAYLLLLLASILLNFAFSVVITMPGLRDEIRGRWLTIGIVADLLVLVYYKYLYPLLNFFAKHHIGSHHFADVFLPLGISFFTFTQIAYLIDIRQGIAERQSLLSYTVFVTFFPHLIAGPIIHPREIMPQMDQIGALKGEDIAQGLSWFVLGLAKKVLIADRVAPGANLLFGNPHNYGTAATWIGLLSYSMQLYFDFSGYSDMALGLARIFSIEFPFNFDSPYKSSSIIVFWTRWHMTLSRYIADYLYTPLVRGVAKRRRAAGKRINHQAQTSPSGFANIVAYPLLTSMFIAGVWHGAGLTFVAFGLLHGIYLVINHAWRLLTPEGHPLHGKLPAWAGVILTFGAVLLGQVFFRANDMQSAAYILKSLLGLHSVGNPTIGTAKVMSTLVICPLIIWLMPNVQQIIGRPTEPIEGKHWWQPWLEWKPNFLWSVALTLLFCLSIVEIDPGAGFLYFQF